MSEAIDAPVSQAYLTGNVEMSGKRTNLAVQLGEQSGDRAEDTGQQGLEAESGEDIVEGARDTGRSILETGNGLVEDGKLLGDAGQELLDSLTVGVGESRLCELTW